MLTVQIYDLKLSTLDSVSPSNKIYFLKQFETPDIAVQGSANRRTNPLSHLSTSVL